MIMRVWAAHRNQRLVEVPEVDGVRIRRVWGDGSIGIRRDRQSRQGGDGAHEDVGRFKGAEGFGCFHGRSLAGWRMDDVDELSREIFKRRPGAR